MEQHWSAGGVFGDVRMREALDQLLAMKESGATKAEQDAFLQSQFPQTITDRRDWCTCNLCRDEGTVRVWSQRAMTAYLTGKLEDRKNRTTARIACECDKGRRLVGAEEKGKPKPLFGRCYDPQLDCLCDDQDSMEDINELERWCDEKRNAKPANYDRGFDEWNERA